MFANDFVITVVIDRRGVWNLDIVHVFCPTHISPTWFITFFMQKALVLTIILISYCVADAQTTGKRPVIIIPGITGSELIDATGDKVWFSAKRSKKDDLRLPIQSPVLARNRDTLRVGDIIREVKLPVLPDVEVYQGVIDALKARGYTEADWTKPKATDVFYVFPYDWRRDNVESAHQLMRKMIAAKRALRRSDLKFDIIAHSMGGLVARYAAMYGLADLSAGSPQPNMSGGAHIQKIMMFGTPNEGSFDAFEALLKGYPIIAGRKLPLVDDLRPEDVLATPAIFQLLPHRSSALFLDENLKPLAVDIYDPAVWLKYGWGAIAEPKFLSKLKDAAALAAKNKDIKPEQPDKDANQDDLLISRTTYAQVSAYFASVLNRAKQFHRALDVPSAKLPFEIYAYGGNCEQTLNTVVLTFDAKENRWHTLLDARDIKTSAGTEIKKDVVKAAMFAKGDGRVTEESLLTSKDVAAATNGLFPLKTSFFACSSHTKLFLDKPIQDSYLSSLVVETQKQP